MNNTFGGRGGAEQGFGERGTGSDEYSRAASGDWKMYLRSPPPPAVWLGSFVCSPTGHAGPTVLLTRLALGGTLSAQCQTIILLAEAKSTGAHLCTTHLLLGVDLGSEEMQSCQSNGLTTSGK